MIVALTLLVPILAASLWLFISLSPKHAAKPRMTAFNMAVVIFGFFLCGAVTIKVYFGMSGGADRAWWPVISGLYALVLFPTVVFVGGVIRNFIVFKSK